MAAFSAIETEKAIVFAASLAMMHLCFKVYFLAALAAFCDIVAFFAVKDNYHACKRRSVLAAALFVVFKR